MIKVVPIGLAAPVPAVVRQAKTILKHAQEGTLRSLIWAGDAEGHVKSGQTEIPDSFAMVGHLERLKHRLMVNMDDRMETEADDNQS